jgi:peptidoglycan hydrolase-like protein with peptidoglycan-binding domain
MTPLIPLVAGGLGLWALSSKKTSAATATAKQTVVTGSWTDTTKPTGERMALALATRSPDAIQTLAGQLQAAGQTVQAQALLAEAAVLGGTGVPITSAGTPAPTTAPTTAATQAAAPAAQTIPSGLPTLAPGEVLQFQNPAPYDTRVAQWQKFLVTIGIPIGSTGVDGKFGDSTRTATMQFQTLAGLNPDGVVGDQTLAAAAAV